MRRAAAWTAALLLGAALLPACQKDPAAAADGDLVEIRLGAAVGAPSASIVAGDASAATRATVDGLEPLTFKILRIDETASKTWAGSYTAFSASRPSLLGFKYGELAFSATQYYQTNGLRSRLTGYYPESGTWTTVTQTASWAIDGSTDILLADPVEGTKTSTTPLNLDFRHALAQVQIYACAESEKAASMWGGIAKVEVRHQRRIATYTPSTAADALPALVFTDAASQTFAVTNLVDRLSSLPAAVGDPMMIEPHDDDYELEIEVTPTKGDKQRLVVAARPYPAGQARRMVIVFGERKVRVDEELTATIVPWETVTGPKTGAYPYRDGNYLVFVDKLGMADPDQWPTHDDWTVTPTHTAGAVEDPADGFNTVGRKFQVSNVFNNPNNLSMADICSTKSFREDERDKGSWRLPTLLELKAIYENFNCLELNSPLWPTPATATKYPSGGYWTININGQYTDKSSFTLFFCVRDAETRMQYPASTGDNFIFPMLEKSDEGNVIFNFRDGDIEADCPIHDYWTVTPVSTNTTGAFPYDGGTGDDPMLSVGARFQAAKAFCGEGANYTWAEATAADGPCSTYSEDPAGVDVGTWRLPTAMEANAIVNASASVSGSKYHARYPDCVIPLDMGAPLAMFGSVSGNVILTATQANDSNWVCAFRAGTLVSTRNTFPKDATYVEFTGMASSTFHYCVLCVRDL